MGDFRTGLIALWKFDDGVGTAAADSSDSVHPGTLSGGTLPTWVAGKIGTFALEFTGANFVDSSNFADNLSAFSVSAWFKTSTTHSGGGGMIVSKLGSGGAATGPGWMLLFQGLNFAENTVAIVIQHSGGTVYRGRITTPTYDDGLWHHVLASVSNFSDIPDLYIDGDVPATSTISNGTVTTITNANNVRIATDYDSEFFIGFIDDVRIYDRALTAADALELYRYPKYIFG